MADRSRPRERKRVIGGARETEDLLRDGWYRVSRGRVYQCHEAGIEQDLLNVSSVSVTVSGFSIYLSIDLTVISIEP